MEDQNKPRHQDGFKIPENYFNDLEDKILHRVAMETQPKKGIQFTGSKIWIWSAAASLIIAGMIILQYRQTPDSGKVATTNPSQPDAQELYEYANSADLNEDEFATLLPGELVDSLYLIEIVSNPSHAEEKTVLINIEEEYSVFDIDNEI